MPVTWLGKQRRGWAWGGGWGAKGSGRAGGSPSSLVLQNAHKVPPPWLIAMQRYGPPPSYPNLKIPGLNSPIPEVRAFLSVLLLREELAL